MVGQSVSLNLDLDDARNLRACHAKLAGVCARAARSVGSFTSGARAAHVSGAAHSSASVSSKVCENTTRAGVIEGCGESLAISEGESWECSLGS